MYVSGRLLMFLYQGWYLHKNKRKTFFKFMYDKFWFDGDFYVRNLDPTVELRQY